RNYLQFYRAWKSRLAILELSKEDAFGDASFIENLHFSTRIEFRSTLLRNLRVYELQLIIRALQSLDQDSDVAKLLESASELERLILNNQPSSEKDKELKETIANNAKTKTIYDENIALLERIGASLR